MRKLIFLKNIVSGDEVVSSRVQNTGGGGCQQNPTCPGGKLGKQASHPGFCNKPVKRVKVDHHCQGLESDYSTSIILPDQKDSCQCGGSHKLDEDLGGDLRQRTTEEGPSPCGTAL